MIFLGQEKNFLIVYWALISLIWFMFAAFYKYFNNDSIREV